jgi:hypothetical protein
VSRNVVKVVLNGKVASVQPMQFSLREVLQIGFAAFFGKEISSCPQKMMVLG